MRKPSKILYHIDLLKIIKSWRGAVIGKMVKVHSPLDGIEATVNYKHKGFNVDFSDGLRSFPLDVGQRYKKISFESDLHKVVFEQVWLLHYSPPSFSGDVDFFYTKGYSKKKKFYYRLVFLLNQKFDFHYQIEETGYTSDLVWSRTATKAVVAGDELIAYTFSDEKNSKHYFAIETEVKMNYDTFSDKAFALKSAIGYLTGFLAGDGGYFFAYQKKKMEAISHYYYCSFRDSIKSSYSPLHTNPYNILHGNQKIAAKLYAKNILRTVSIDELSNFANKLYESLDFAGAIVLILESSIASLLFMPGGYSIALETLSDLILGDDKLKLAPIKDRPKSKALRKGLLKILDNECSTLPPDDFAVLKNRIEQINQVTNGERLKAPFTKLGIELLEKDIEILKSRNDFLHGRIPDLSKSIVESEVDKKNRDLYYASVRFYTLLNILILKWIGFNNYVINYPKLNEGFTKIKLKENYYRKL
jgi:hypothetical protein